MAARGNLSRMSPWYGNILKEYRLKKGLTQFDLAILSGTTKNNVSAIERSCWEPTAYRHFTFVDVLGSDFHFAVLRMWQLTSHKGMKIEG